MVWVGFPIFPSERFLIRAVNPLAFVPSIILYLNITFISYYKGYSGGKKNAENRFKYPIVLFNSKILILQNP